MEHAHASNLGSEEEMNSPATSESHTPGPWDRRQRYNALQDEIGIDGHALVTVWVRKPMPQKDDTRDRVEAWPAGEANARLISAAPDLLNALETLADAAEARGIPADAARAAIKKARG